MFVVGHGRQQRVGSTSRARGVTKQAPADGAVALPEVLNLDSLTTSLRSSALRAVSKADGAGAGVAPLANDCRALQAAQTRCRPASGKMLALV